MAAVRRAVQQQGAQQLQALHWPNLIRGGITPKDAVASDVKLRVPLPMAPPCHDWSALQDRRWLIPQTHWNYGAVRGYYNRHISQLVSAASNKRAFLVDTLSLVRRLESQGLTAKQAEAITAVITEVLNDSLETVAQTFTSKSELQRSEMMMEAALSKFKGEMQSNQEHHFSLLQRETERLRTDIDKMRSELRYEVDKVTAGHRLDLNLERGLYLGQFKSRIRDELATQSAETSNLTNKLDREIHTLKTQLEAAKYDIIKYCIGSIISVAAVGLGMVRIIM